MSAPVLEVRAHGRSDPRLGLAGGLVVAGLGAYAVVDAAFFGAGAPQRLAYALVWAATLLALLLTMSRVAYPPRAWWLLATWLFVVALHLLPVVRQQPLYPAYVAGDAASLVLPVLILLAGLGAPALFGRRGITIVCTSLVAGMLVAPLLGASGNRFEAPSSLLIAAGVWLMIARTAGRWRLIGGLLSVATFAVSMASGQRTSVLVWLAVAGCAVLLRIGLKATLVLTSLLLFAAIGPARGLIVGAATSSLQQTRFSSVVGGESDESLLARVQEGFDVVRTLGTEGGPVEYLLGFGHGATYKPQFSFLARNVTDEGRVHNVHIGPVLVLFRYGAVGLGFVVLLAGAAASRLLAASRAARATSPPVADLFAVAIVAYLVEGLMFNVLVDPLFSFTLAGFLFHTLNWRDAVDLAPMTHARAGA
jgi:hypothetical protein